MERKTAIISKDLKYRYHLGRYWDDSKETITFIMLNPGTADHEIENPTIRRCIGFAKSWDYGGCEIVNMFAFRATKPKDLKKEDSPEGPENMEWIRNFCKERKVIVSWGSHGTHRGQDSIIIDLLKEIKSETYCLGKTKDGIPRHPLFVRADKELELI